MKRFVHILIPALLFALCASCEREPGAGDAAGNWTVFRLAGLSSDGFSAEAGPRTRDGVTSGLDLGPYTPVDFTKYAVKFYLFECADRNNSTDLAAWNLIRIDDITTPLYRIQGLQPDSHYYRYLFVAARREQADRLAALDFASGIAGDPGADSYPTLTQNTPARAGTPSVPGSLLPNCYFRIADRDDIRYGADLALPVDDDPEIFAGGFFYLSPFDVHTPVSVVMHRQVGVVEFQIDLEAGAHELSCSVPSDYYRLYLSQLIRNGADYGYTSANEAQDGNWIYMPGDYGSQTHFSLSEDAADDMLFFTRRQSVTLPAAQRYNFRVYMPYTADTSETLTTDRKANYNRTRGEASTLTLTVDGRNYTYKEPFPVLRNTKTFFFIKGAQLVVTFGEQNGGIGLDDDDWDGIK